MPKILLSLDGVVSRQVQLTQERTTLGRRPYNDVVLDHLAVSGEHAALLLEGDEVSIEDLDSTNGTFVNGRAIKKQRIGPDDVVEIGRYQLTLDRNGAGGSSRAAPIDAHDGSSGGGGQAARFERSRPGASASAATEIAPVGGSNSAPVARLKVLTGPAAGRELRLDKPVTTVGLPGVTVASITQRGDSFVLQHTEGPQAPTINGTPLGSHPLTLYSGDLISVAGNDMRFEQR